MIGSRSFKSRPGEIKLQLRCAQLRLIFTCCHHVLNKGAQVALTLRLVGGLTTAEIARTFLVSEDTMGQRLVRAKSKIRNAGIPYRIPDESELAERLQAVLEPASLAPVDQSRRHE